MRKLPLAALGAMAAVGLTAGAAQAEPVPLTLEQMDEMTAGQLRVVLTTSSQASSRSEVTGEGTAWASAWAQASASASFSFGPGDDVAANGE